MLTAEGVKISEWNKSLAHALSDQALIKLIKAGFTSPSDISDLVTDEEVGELELSLRDRAAMRKIATSCQNSI